MSTAPLKFWGWGREGEGPSEPQATGVVKTLGALFGADDLTLAEPPRIEDLKLPEPSLTPPAALAEICHREFGIPLRSANVERGASG